MPEFSKEECFQHMNFSKKIVFRNIHIYLESIGNKLT